MGGTESEQIQEISIETQENDKKPKRIMSEAQKENLTKARAKAYELRQKLKEKKGPSITKKKTKLELELDSLNKPDVIDDVIEEVPEPKKVTHVIVEEDRPKIIRDPRGFFYIL
jgi:hypothetical protein